MGVSYDINVKKSSSTSETGASADELSESLVAAVRDLLLLLLDLLNQEF